MTRIRFRFHRPDGQTEDGGSQGCVVLPNQHDANSAIFHQHQPVLFMEHTTRMSLQDII